MIDPATLAALPDLVSAPRLRRYLDRYPGRPDFGTRLYAWNVELTGAFWGPVSQLEVILRNAVHGALAAERREDWWNDPSVHLMPRERRAVDIALRTLERRGNPDPLPGEVVATTSLGFWVGLTDGGVPRDPRLSYETALWQPRIVKAFPGLGSVRRKALHRRLDDIRRFRNRLAHHEPIYSAPLATVRDDIIGVAGFVHADAAAFIGGAHRIDDVIARMEAAVSSGDSVI